MRVSFSHVFLEVSSFGNNKNLLCMHIFLINVRIFVLDVRVERVEGRSPIATLSNDMC
jgi:hypothetical protein